MDNVLKVACLQIINESARIGVAKLQSFCESQSQRDLIKEYGTVRFAWHVINHCWDIPSCGVCGKETTWLSSKRRYGFTCGRACSSLDTTRVARIRDTMMDRYGVENASQCQVVKARKRATMQKNHGVDYPAQSPDLRRKQLDTMMDRYGVAFPMQRADFKQQAADTIKQRYGANGLAATEISDKKRNTNKDRYGVDHHSQLQEIKDQKKDTMRENWGVENPSQHPDIQQRKKNTSMERLGVEWPGQSTDVRKKIEKTSIDRYGATSSLGNTMVRKKGEDTLLSTYGVKHPQQSPVIRKKTIETNQARYGTDIPSQNKEVKDRISSTNLKRYGATTWWASESGREALKNIHLQVRGVDNPSKDPAVIDKIRQTMLKTHGVPSNNYFGMDAKTITIITDPAEFSKYVAGKTVADVSANLGINASTVYRLSRDHNCRDVMKITENSYEKKILDILDQFSISYIRRTRDIISPYELDIYLPDRNLAIEVGSAYWHGERYNKQPSYHFNKWQQCKQRGIDLFQWFDEDIHSNWHLTSSRLLRAIGVGSQVIGARQLLIGTCTIEEERCFLEKWHAKGFTSHRNYTVAARWQDDIVALLTINARNNVAVIERWATDVTKSWPGAFSRCLSHWIQHTDFTGDINSWCDNRLGNGRVYMSAGFNEIRVSRPGYWYVRNDGLENRQRYQKHKLQAMFNLTDDDMLLSESEIMRSKGYDRLWDAGHTLWRKTIK